MLLNYHTGALSPGGIYWKLTSEYLFFLALTRALLLEVAHPLIAAGVVDHSTYRTAPIKRLYRTYKFTMAVNFGSAKQMNPQLKFYHLIHRHVQGTLREDLGEWPAGTSYEGREPHLRLWVFAASFDSILLFHEHFRGVLSTEVKEQAYLEAKNIACLLGIPADQVPATYSDFQQYVDEMLERLAVGTDGKDVVEALFTIPLIGPLARIGCHLGIGLLPVHIRQGFELTWTARDQRGFDRFTWLLRHIYPRIPRPLRMHPYVLWNEFRWQINRLASSQPNPRKS